MQAGKARSGEERGTNRRGGSSRTTRRGLLTGAFGLIPAADDPPPDRPGEAETSGGTGEARYRSYREGVANVRRREQGRG